MAHQMITYLEKIGYLKNKGDIKMTNKHYNWVNDMIDFETNVMKSKHPTTQTFPDEQTKDLRIKLLNEEMKETIDAMNNYDMEEIADGIVDSIVILIGTALTYGINILPVWDEVYRTNMAKAGGKLREDGKLLKPEGWQPPNIKKILKEQGWDQTK